MMGLANLVPGISGGTMLVAAGVYRRFIDAVSDLSRLRIRARPLLTVAVVAGAAVASIGVFAALVSEALLQWRWGMYALFIGLTLGGVPVLWASLRPATASAWLGAAIGMLGMIALALVQSDEVSAGSRQGGLMLALGGAAGAGAMILPGVSGAYLLLLLGQYRPILEAIRSGAAAASDRDLAAMLEAAGTLVPVGIGVLLGLVLVSNILRALLHRFEKATLGVLLGLLLGAPAGLYPFKQGVPPAAGTMFRGEILDAAGAQALATKPKDWPEVRFTPQPLEVAGALGMVVVGGMLTLGVARLGRRGGESGESA